MPVLADQSKDIAAYEQIVQEKMVKQEEPKTKTGSQSYQLVQDDLVKKLNNPEDVKDSKSYDTIYESEPNFPISAANQIYLNYYVTGTNSPYYDLDYYKLTITQSGTLSIIGVAGAYGQYMAIGLEDRNGNKLKYSSVFTSSNGTISQVLDCYVSPGTYYIAVFGMPLYMGSSYYPLVGERYMFQTSMYASGGTVTDTTPPTVTTTDPQRWATNVPIDKTFLFTYDEAIKIIDGSKIYFYNYNTFVRTYAQTRVEGNKLYITPNNNFLAYTKYMSIIDSGGVTDLSGNAPDDYYWSFTTGGNAVSSVLVTSVTLEKTSTSITRGNTETLAVTINPSNATNKSVSWSSSNQAVATVNANGVVTAVGAGNATITVTTTDGGKTTGCYVTVTNPIVKVSGISLNIASISLIKGNTKTLIGSVTPSDATNKTSSWISSDSTVATVNSGGLISAVGPGTATITVITADGGKTASCYVTVTLTDIPKVITITTTSLDTGTVGLPYNVTMAASVGTSPYIWSATGLPVGLSINSSTGVVSGTPTAAGTSTVTVTVTTVDGSKTATYSVEVSANTLPVKQDISLDKEWRISFSQPVDSGTIQSNILLWRIDPVTKAKVKVDITSVIDPSNSKVVIVKHSTPFVIGTSYELSVNVGIKDVLGKSLSKASGLVFVIGNK